MRISDIGFLLIDDVFTKEGHLHSRERVYSESVQYRSLNNLSKFMSTKKNTRGVVFVENDLATAGFKDGRLWPSSWLCIVHLHLLYNGVVILRGDISIDRFNTLAAHLCGKTS